MQDRKLINPNKRNKKIIEHEYQITEYSYWHKIISTETGHYSQFKLCSLVQSAPSIFSFIIFSALCGRKSPAIARPMCVSSKNMCGNVNKTPKKNDNKVSKEKHGEAGRGR